MTALQMEPLEAADALAGAGGVHVLHSHHYHAALQRAVYEADDIDGTGIFSGAAVAAGMAVLPLPVSGDSSVMRDWLAASFLEAGLGVVDLTRLSPDGEGVVVLRGSHFAGAWLHRFPRSTRPVCAASAAVLSANASRAFDTSLLATETACVASGASECRFQLRTSADGVNSMERPTTHEDDEAAVMYGAAGSVRPAPATADPFGGPLAGNATGAIMAPGGPFARLPADFYASVTHRFEREIPQVRGAKFGNLPGILLLEAAHRNGFHLFGELLRSAAWTELEAQPDTTDAQLQLILAAVWRLGWGSWEVGSFAPGERLIVRIADSYEAMAHLRLHGRGGGPRCYVARGAVAAVMNLLFRGGGSRGPALTASHYNQLFRSPASFRAVETRCRALGDPYCEVVANPLSL